MKKAEVKIQKKDQKGFKLRMTVYGKLFTSKKEFTSVPIPDPLILLHSIITLLLLLNNAKKKIGHKIDKE